MLPFSFFFSKVRKERRKKNVLYCFSVKKMKYVELTGSNGDTIKLYIGKCHLSNYEEQDNTTHQMSIRIDELPDDLATQVPYSSSSDTYTWPSPTSQYINLSGNAMDKRSITIESNKKQGDYTNTVDITTGVTGTLRTFLKMYLADTNYGISLFISSLFNGYRTKFAKTTKTPYSNSINYCYLLYDEDLVRYNLLGLNGIKTYYDNSNGYSYITSENKSNYYLYTGGIVFVNFWSKPSVGVEYPAFRRHPPLATANCPIDLTDDNLNNYAFLITPFTFWEADGYINGFVGYDNGTSLSGAIGASIINEMFCLEQGMLNNLKEDEPEPEPEKGEGPMIGPLETGMVKMYTTEGNAAGIQDIKNVGKGVFAKDFMDALSNYWNAPAEGIVNFQLFPFDLSTMKDASGNAIVNTTKEIVAIYGVALPSGATMETLNNEYAVYDCGSLNCPVGEGYFYNHSPYTKASLFLPYCGDCPIDIDDFIGGYIHIKMIIDLYNGNIVYEVYKKETADATEEDLQYRFSGNVSYSIPLTGRDWGSTYASAIQAGASLVASVI